jgi:hypothetical protein
MKCGPWAKILRDEVEKIFVGLIWQNPQVGNAKTVFKLINQRFKETDQSEV